MYTIIGGDGNEYGPVTAGQVRQWIAEGRANLQTKVRPLGTEGWREIGELAEFSGGPAASATGAGGSGEGGAARAAPGESTVTWGAGGAAGAASGAGGAPGAPAGPLDIGFCYERAWSLLKANFWPLVGAYTLVTVIGIGIGFIPIVGMVAGLLLVNVILNAGLYVFILKLIRGEKAGINDLFEGFRRAPVTIFLACWTMFLLGALGLLLLILPGIYLLVSWTFGLAIAVDRPGTGSWECLETSRLAIRGQWWRIFGMGLLGLVFLFIGALALGVGFLIAAPFVLAALLYAYEDLVTRPLGAPGRWPQR